MRLVLKIGSLLLPRTGYMKLADQSAIRKMFSSSKEPMHGFVSEQVSKGLCCHAKERCLESSIVKFKTACKDFIFDF